MAKSTKTEGWATRDAIDWTKQSAEGPPPLAKGVYRGKIVEAEALETSKGSPAVRVIWEASTDFAGEPARGSKKAYVYLVCTQEAAWKVLQLTLALGIEPPSDFGFDTLTDFAESLVGAECYATIDSRTYEGRASNDLKRFMGEEEARKIAEGTESTAEVVSMRGRSRKQAIAAE